MLYNFGCGVSGVWFRVKSASFRVWNLGFEIQGLGFRIEGLPCFKVGKHSQHHNLAPSFGFRVKGLRVQGYGCRVQGSGFPDLGLKLKGGVHQVWGVGLRILWCRVQGFEVSGFWFEVERRGQGFKF